LHEEFTVISVTEFNRKFMELKIWHLSEKNWYLFPSIRDNSISRNDGKLWKFQIGGGGKLWGPI